MAGTYNTRNICESKWRTHQVTHGHPPATRSMQGGIKAEIFFFSQVVLIFQFLFYSLALSNFNCCVLPCWQSKLCWILFISDTLQGALCQLFQPPHSMKIVLIQGPFLRAVCVFDLYLCRFSTCSLVFSYSPKTWM